MKSSANLGVLCASALITFLLSSIHHNQLPEPFVKNFAKKHNVADLYHKEQEEKIYISQ